MEINIYIFSLILPNFSFMNYELWIKKAKFASMENPLISIITIARNAATEIKATMRSVAGQNFRDFEHILIDGASSDDTIAVAHENAAIDRLRILSEPDKGIYDAMNKGLRMARGKYLLFLNAGDALAAPDTLSLYADAIKKSDPDIIYGDTLIVDSQRDIIRQRHLHTPECLSFESFSHGMLICHQAFMVRRAIAPSYDTSYRLSADYDWTIRCIAATTPAKCINLHAVTIHYLDAGATEQNKLASLRERFDIMTHHYGRTKTIMRHISFIPRIIKRRILNR